MVAMNTPVPVEASELRTARAGETEPFEALSSGAVTDAFRLLDHRGASRSVTPKLARRGVYLALRDGAETRLIPLESRITHIGRGIGADLRFEDQRVSRSHAIIVRHGRFARVLDNRSSNGTFLNGRRIVATNLSNGDELHIGPVAMQYVEVR